MINSVPDRTGRDAIDEPSDAERARQAAAAIEEVDTDLLTGLITDAWIEAGDSDEGPEPRSTDGE